MQYCIQDKGTDIKKRNKKKMLKKDKKSIDIKKPSKYTGKTIRFIDLKPNKGFEKERVNYV